MSRIALGALAAVMLWAAPFLLSYAQAQTASSTTTDATSTEDISTPEHAAMDPFNPDDVEAKVRSYFADIPVMISIAKCESGFRQYDDMGNPLYGGTGGMVGVFQEAAAIHNSAAKDLGLNINTLDGNLAYARHLYEESGVVPWLASAGCWSPLKTTLKLGSSGSQVAKLQKILNDNGFIVAKDGPGSPGQESTTFGPATREAVRRLQCSMGIVCKGAEYSTGYGLVGQKTRVALLKLSGSVALTPASNLSQR